MVDVREVTGITVVRGIKKIKQDIKQTRIEMAVLAEKLHKIVNLHPATSDGQKAKEDASKNLEEKYKKCKARFGTLIAEQEVAEIDNVFNSKKKDKR